jgi:NADH-quinone oxidoreductase subunit N
MLLYGMSMLYGATGTLEITELSRLSDMGVQAQPVFVFGVVFIVAGLGFKLGAVPFHMWVPDVYHGAPTAVTLFIGSAPKLAAFAMVMRLLAQGLGGETLSPDWQQMLVIMAVLSLAVGNLAAIMQTNLKRMLAYSTISHMGFLLLGVLSATVDGYGAGMYYVVVYVLMTLGSFGLIQVLAREGFEAEELEDYRGLNQRSPWNAFLMLLLMFSMAGIPPTVGFYAKLTVLQSVVHVGLWWLAVVAVVFSLIGAFYYLRVVKLMYFDDPVTNVPLVATTDVRTVLTLNGLAVLVLGVMPQPLLLLCVESVRASI